MEWMPPTRENYELLLSFFQLAYPVFGSMQWIINWYGMGKTSVQSRLNIPGRVAWMTMESPGFLTLLYIMNTLPQKVGIDNLPWQNRVLGGLYVIHYAYRAVLFPILQPSMAPIHLGVWLIALGFQICNATCLASWLSGYGPTTAEAWSSASSIPQFIAGIGLFYLGLALNFFHDEELREIRHKEQRRRERIRAQAGDESDAQKIKVDKHYEIPQGGLFKFMLYPHYFCEWVEWLGFYIAAGWGCAPARAFLVNEISAMLPRAVNGKKWYIKEFGEEKVGKKWAVIPGVL